MRRPFLAVAVALVLFAPGCGGNGGDAAADLPDYASCRTDEVADAPSGVPEGPPVEGVVPVWIAGVPGATSVAFVEETGGTLVSTREGQLHHLAEPIGGPGEVVLDLADRVATDGQEQGMFAVAIAKDGRHLYLSFTAAGDGALTILEYAVADGLPDPDTERLVMEIPQPGVTHNGGQLVTDDAGMLWISVGDGEAAPSDDLAAWGNARDAQELDNLYGKILRIDPEPSGGESYTVPEDNPFVDAPDARSEIWAYGLRNPWRFTFDRETGDLWIGDVGQFCWEEIDLAPASSGAGAGDNFGWPAVEGAHEYRMAVPEATELPVYEISREPDDRGIQACSVAGGYRYRGDGIPQLQGGYVYGDSCRPELFALFPDGDGGWVRRSLRIDLRFVVGFGEDPRGELYVVSLFDGVHRLDFGENDGQYLDVGGESGDEPTRPTPDG